MKNTIYVFAVCIIVSLFTGCTKYWYRPDTSFEQCQQDRKACLDALLQRSDVSYLTDYEIKFMETCMRQKGYELVEKSKLPMEAKRQDPETSLHWRINGIAGSVD